MRRRLLRQGAAGHAAGRWPASARLPGVVIPRRGDPAGPRRRGPPRRGPGHRAIHRRPLLARPDHPGRGGPPPAARRAARPAAAASSWARPRRRRWSPRGWAWRCRAHRAGAVRDSRSGWTWGRRAAAARGLPARGRPARWPTSWTGARSTTPWSCTPRSGAPPTCSCTFPRSRTRPACRCPPWPTGAGSTAPTPRLVDALPNGPANHPTVRVFVAGGVPEVMLHLRRAGLIDPAALTAAGGDLGRGTRPLAGTRRAATSCAATAVEEDGVDPDLVIMDPDTRPPPGADQHRRLPRPARWRPTDRSSRRRRSIQAWSTRTGVYRHRGPVRLFGSEGAAVAAIKGTARAAGAGRRRGGGRRHRPGRHRHGGDLPGDLPRSSSSRGASRWRGAHRRPLLRGLHRGRASATSVRRRWPGGRSAACRTATRSGSWSTAMSSPAPWSWSPRRTKASCSRNRPKRCWPRVRPRRASRRTRACPTTRGCGRRCRPPSGGNLGRLRLRPGCDHRPALGSAAVERAPQGQPESEPARPVTRDPLFDRVILRCVVGSRAYGLARDDSDTDRRGLYLPPADLHWSLSGAPQQLQNDATPGGVLGDSEVPDARPERESERPGVPLYAARGDGDAAGPASCSPCGTAFCPNGSTGPTAATRRLSSRRMQSGLRNHGRVKWKHVMHLLRLLLSGTTVLTEGFVAVDVSDYRERLIAVRSGRVPWEEADAWRLELIQAFDAAYARTALPDQPDHERVDRFLISARRRALQDGLPMNPVMPDGWRRCRPTRICDRPVEGHPYPLLFVTISGRSPVRIPVPGLRLRSARRSSAAAGARHRPVHRGRKRSTLRRRWPGGRSIWSRTTRTSSSA